MELSQIRLVVQDFPRVFRFYRDVFGLTPQFDDERGPYAKFAFPQGNAALALHAREDLEKLTGPLPFASAPRALVVVHVANVDQTVAELKARGAEIHREPVDAWGRLRVAYLFDPEGNLLELQQWLLSRPAT